MRRPHEPPVLIDQAEWSGRVARHQARVDAWLQPRLERRRRGQAHPVDDFLFDYYYVRPTQLRAWHPGHGCLLGGAADGWLAHPAYARLGGGIGTTAASLRPRLPQARAILRLLRNTAARPPAFGCFALHEWAMVYALRPDEVRHGGWPLRPSPTQIAGTVADLGLRCTHVDAYRFFTPAATPLNAYRPTRASQADLEQPGCLHATMDLYKWAAKLSPHVGSDLVADCFALARTARDLDMRAAPYDLTALGVTPVPIETAAGRAEFVAAQRAVAADGDRLRDLLIAAIEDLLRAAQASDPPPDPRPDQPRDEAGDATGEATPQASGAEPARGPRPPGSPASRPSSRPGGYSSSATTASPSSASTLPSAS